MRLAKLIPLLLLASTAHAGPDVRPEFVCKGTVALVDVLSVDDGASRLMIRRPAPIDRFRSCGDERFHPEGCVISHAQITAKASLRVGHLYLAMLEPTGGADCSTTATATHWLRVF